LMVNERKTFTINEYYQKFNTSEKTARRDFKKLISLGFVEKIGSTNEPFNS